MPNSTGLISSPVTFLILSDIHGNREALEGVLAHAQGSYDQILCLGDLVGYGADPNFAVDWARANVAAIVRGNHDREVSQGASLDSYRQEARDGILWTRQALSADNLDYLSRLPQGPLAHQGTTLVHGSPVDEDAYLLKPADIESVLPHLKAHLTFFGHTHVQGGFSAGGGVRAIDPACLLQIKAEDFYLVNPGSVGQPRDGNWRAAYALYSPEEQRVEFARVSYNVGPTAEKIVLAGMPATLAARLLMGM
jgi:predicted phosphodiesterase